MSHLVQLLLPLYRNDGLPLESAHFDTVRDELTQQFGGMTAYTRAPAEGRWQEDGHVSRDDVVVIEVMVDELDRQWWQEYQERLERRFEQQEIVTRAWTVQRL